MYLRPLIAVIALGACLSASADTITAAIVSSIERGNITVRQPQSVGRLLQRQEAAQTPSDGTGTEQQHRSTRPAARTGYRVQVFDDNNPRSARREAEARHARIQNEFPHMRSYVSFDSPYWRVKVGDFRTRAEAEAAMAELRRAFPAMSAYMRVIRDKINISE